MATDNPQFSGDRASKPLDMSEGVPSAECWRGGEWGVAEGYKVGELDVLSHEHLQDPTVGLIHSNWKIRSEEEGCTFSTYW